MSDYWCYPIDAFNVILGMPWLKKYNPHIDWNNNQISFNNSNEQRARDYNINNKQQVQQQQTEYEQKGKSKKCHGP